MPRPSCMVFAARYLPPEEIRGKEVIEVGSCDFNGSIKPYVMHWEPKSYLGIDMIEGPCVDKVLNADLLEQEYGAESFDIVLSIEMMEHTRWWRTSLTNMKRICRRGGILIITSPAIGYPYHGYPTDFWRYEIEDMKKMLSDFEILGIERDESGPGTFVAARKPMDYQECDLDPIELYSVVNGQRTRELSEEDFKSKYFKRVTTKVRIKVAVESTYRWLGRTVTKLLRI
ncbi:methyltransferase domain-containing protein [Ruficoccus sp. ZRK36]|uniref:methyltransferase domain-containing protein n=1 Tax=Ruficoccus sp. ZRK36 TaxID=2866311 RepID=UPI001C73B285|nr:methyltransferase domain-containing protein [Ruficoccus sp. ZRK36]QYY36321.1 class I SAM-dependent methyltransferase [Ruficoccus sp. ZRK36]